MGFDEEKVTFETCEALEEVTESSESTGVQLTDDQLEKVSGGLIRGEDIIPTVGSSVRVR